jgi:hypothetical protein
VERHTADLAHELKRHHALADAARRFTSDAAELLDWLARQKRLLDSDFFSSFGTDYTAAAEGSEVVVHASKADAKAGLYYRQY